MGSSAKWRVKGAKRLKVDGLESKWTVRESERSRNQKVVQMTENGRSKERKQDGLER